MPKKRTRSRITLTLRELGIRARLDFLVGWHPPTNPFECQQSPRWRTFRDFLNDYELVRDEKLAWRAAEPGDFAEQLYQRVAADPRGDVEVIGRAVWTWKYPNYTKWMLEAREGVCD